MNEYSYEIDKYIVGVDSNGEDGIGLTIATMKDNKLYILGSCYGDNARFIDLLIKENEELKKHLKVPETCDLKTLEDYKNYYEDTTREQILADTYIDYCAYVNLAHRYRQLKKQVEELKKPQIFIDTGDMEERYGEELYQTYLEEQVKELKKQLEYCYCNRTDCSARIKDSRKYDSLVQKVETQQQEFIKYLEKERERCLTFYCRTECAYACDAFTDVLAKYKEIIGNDINVGSKGGNKDE